MPSPARPTATIDPSIADSVGGDESFRSLCDVGLRDVQQLAKAVWTDYNDHDPGVTILQLACYALSEVAYRIDTPIVDLIADPSGAEAGQALFPGTRILTCDPVTIDDMRKLAYDSVHNLRNVWMEEVEPELPCGLFRIYVEPYSYEFDLADRKNADPRKILAETIAAHRPFTEDLHEIVLLRPIELVVEADLTIDATVSANDIAATIIAALREDMVPSPRVRSIDEVLADGLSPDLIFDGPLLGVGAIGGQSDRPGFISIPDIERIVGRIAGVVTVDTLSVIADGVAITGETGLIDLTPDRIPVVSEAETIARLRLSRGGSPQRLDPTHVATTIRYVEASRAQHVDAAIGTTAVATYGAFPLGKRPIGVGAYVPIANHFPTVYGIGPEGLPNEPDRLTGAISITGRATKAARLGIYLSGIDQLCANLLAQLDHLPDLFAVARGDDAPTYFPGVVDAPASDPTHIASIIAATDQGRWRREAMLDHLLARFDEHFEDDAWDRLAVANADHPPEAIHDRRIRAKAEFLGDMVDLSARRGTGPNLADPSEGPSALERRIELKCGVDGILAIEHLLLRRLEGEMLADQPMAFYEHRASFLIPEDGEVVDIGLRGFVERAVVENCPAHVESRCFWLDRDTMRSVAACLGAWRTARAAALEDPTVAGGADRAAKPLRAALVALWDGPRERTDDDDP